MDTPRFNYPELEKVIDDLRHDAESLLNLLPGALIRELKPYLRTLVIRQNDNEYQCRYDVYTQLYYWSRESLTTLKSYTLNDRGGMCGYSRLWHRDNVPLEFSVWVNGKRVIKITYQNDKLYNTHDYILGRDYNWAPSVC